MSRWLIHFSSAAGHLEQTLPSVSRRLCGCCGSAAEITLQLTHAAWLLQSLASDITAMSEFAFHPFHISSPINNLFSSFSSYMFLLFNVAVVDLLLVLLFSSPPQWALLLTDGLMNDGQHCDLQDTDRINESMTPPHIELWSYAHSKCLPNSF